jgi:ABC-type nitrate/sulfonate/bicarbonate transport system substrate-binding protein
MPHSTPHRLASVALVLALALVSAGRAQAAQLNVFSGSSPVFAPVFIADAKGFFKEEGVDVSVRTFTSGAEATEGFRAGAAQFLVASDVPLLYLLAGGDVVLLAQFSANPDMLLIIADRQVKSPADLKGKSIGLVRKSASEYLLHQYLKRGGLTLNDVKLVHLAPFDQVPALVRGDVDALSGWKPFDKKIFALAPEKFRTVTWSGQEDYILYSGIVAKGSFVKENPDKVAAVLRALRKASDWLSNQDLKAESAVLGTYLKTSPEDIAHVIENNTWKMVDDASFRETMRGIEEFLVAQDLIKNKVDWARSKDVSFLRKLDPELVKGN